MTDAERRRVAADAQFAALLEEHRGILVSVACTYCPDGEEREDLLQEMRYQLWRAYPRYDPSRRFSTWMYRVVLNTAISFARSARTRRQRTVALDDVAPPELARNVGTGDTEEVTRERREALAASMRELDELSRAVLLLHLEDRSHREIAEVLGMNESNVGTRLSRIRQRLRSHIMARTGGTNDGTR
jgi:RNA polymerase sigma-70 factor (ECF subfamily)